MKNLKGGYKIISLQENDLASLSHLDGLYEAIADSYEKPLLVTGIVISGEKKNDVFTTVNLNGTSFEIEVYGKNVTVEEDDDVTIASIKYGTILYQHELVVDATTKLYIINTSATKYTKIDSQTISKNFNSGSILFLNYWYVNNVTRIQRTTGGMGSALKGFIIRDNSGTIEDYEVFSIAYNTAVTDTVTML